jgi:hypothetical protein
LITDAIYGSTNNDQYDDESFGLWTGSNKSDLLEGIPFYMQQFKALFIKRIINSLRNKALIISQIIIPVCVLLINLIQIKYGPIKAEGRAARR